MPALFENLVRSTPPTDKALSPLGRCRSLWGRACPDFCEKWSRSDSGSQTWKLSPLKHHRDCAHFALTTAFG